MVIVGVILLLAALAVIAFVYLATQDMTPLVIDYGFLNVSVSPLWLFLAGGLTLAVATSACWIIGVGTRINQKRRAEVKRLRAQAQASGRTPGQSRPAAEREAQPTTGRQTQTQTPRPSSPPPGPGPTTDTGSAQRPGQPADHRDNPLER